MESVLYTLAMKFLKPDELRNLKEEFDMTILGQMLMQDGYDKGLKKGQSNGEDRINQLNICLADATGSTISPKPPVTKNTSASY